MSPYVHCCSVYVFAIVWQCWHDVLAKLFRWVELVVHVHCCKGLFCCGNCIVKANEKMDSTLAMYKQCGEQQSVLLLSFVVCCAYWNLLFSHAQWKPLLIRWIRNNTHSSVHYIWEESCKLTMNWQLSILKQLWSNYLPMVNTWVIFYSLITLLCLFIK